MFSFHRKVRLEFHIVIWLEDLSLTAKRPEVEVTYPHGSPTLTSLWCMLRIWLLLPQRCFSPWAHWLSSPPTSTSKKKNWIQFHCATPTVHFHMNTQFSWYFLYCIAVTCLALFVSLSLDQQKDLFEFHMKSWWWELKSTFFFNQFIVFSWLYRWNFSFPTSGSMKHSI